MAEVQASMVLAKEFPRNQAGAIEEIIQACTRPKLADGAVYSFPRGDQQVTGPSIRLAECIAQNWGNICFGVMELSQSQGESSVMSFAWDLQTNTRAVKTFQVAHIRYKKGGKRIPLTDPRDIYEMVANQGARRLRACILAVVPGDVVESAMEQIGKTRENRFKGQDLAEVVKKAAGGFLARYKVTEKMIVAMLRPNAGAEKLDDITITLDEILRLENIWTSLKDGYSKPAQYFDDPDAKPEASQKEKLAAQAKAIEGAADGNELTDEEAASEIAENDANGNGEMLDELDIF
jgi:hypothetical protein